MTLKTAKLGPIIDSTAYIHIYYIWPICISKHIRISLCYGRNRSEIQASGCRLAYAVTLDENNRIAQTLRKQNELLNRRKTRQGNKKK